MSKTKYLKRKPKHRRKTKRGGAAARRKRGITFIPTIITADAITQYFNDTTSTYPYLIEIPTFELTDITVPPFEQRRREINRETSLDMYYYTEPPYFYKKCVFNFENISEPEYQQLIKAFLNELRFNIQAVTLIDTCGFKTSTPNGYHFSVNQVDKTVTFVLRLGYIDLSKTKPIVDEDLPSLKQIDLCLHTHQLQHGDMAKRNIKKMNDGTFLIYDWGEAETVGVGGISNQSLRPVIN